ncbi:MAG: hypothetical protein CHACPFDD_03600 [Phycisphaerae bacterium]|nr:hypothetical protein [Phycisphaerae bacterium]
MATGLEHVHSRGVARAIASAISILAASWSEAAAPQERDTTAAPRPAVPQATDPLRIDAWGHEPYSVASPLDVAVSPLDGTVLVVDAEAGRLVKLDRHLKPFEGVIALAGVTAVDVAADGRFAVATAGRTSSVILFEKSGEPMQTIGRSGAGDGELNGPCGVLFSPDGKHVLVFDTLNSRVQVFDTAGRFQFAFSEYTWDRAYDSEAQHKRIEERVTDHLYRPVRGAFLPNGRLIVADYDGPVINPERNERSGKFTVWQLDFAAKTAEFEQFAIGSDGFVDFKAADVCVDPRSGQIFYAEGDFPLTDHDFIRVSPNVSEMPRVGVKFFPYRFLTHPRAVALTPDGHVLVADADKRQVLRVPRKYFELPAGEINPLEWPKLIRTPVCEPTRVVIEYTTPEPTFTEVECAALPMVAKDDQPPPGGPWRPDGLHYLGWYEYPEQPPVKGRETFSAAALDDQWQPKQKTEPGANHRIELTGLQPGTRYAWRFLVSNEAYPLPLWSETFVFSTAPPPAKTQYTDAEVLVLLFTNLLTKPDSPALKPEPPDPGPMSPEEIEGVKQRLELARRFYWINSRARFNLRFTYVLDDERFEQAPVPNWGYWNNADHRRIDEILARHGVKHADTAGLVAIYGYRHWDEHQKKWLLSGSGGNTWGSVHDGSGITTINAGGDTCWLFVHEYGHQMGINYEYSGQAFHFNHFHWNYLPTDYAAHYDGMAAMLREFSDAAYWTLKYGRLHVVDDADGDGLPDDDPLCPLDEKRFGSDLAKRDTDGDGLDDLEELMSTQGLARYAGAFDMRQIEPVFEPDPRKPDSDGDGTPDGDDRYPLYPTDPSVYRANVVVDGRLGPAEWPAFAADQPRVAQAVGTGSLVIQRGGPKGFCRSMRDADINGELRLAWNEKALFIGLTQKVQAQNGVGEPIPPQIYMELDANNDGFTVGGDNIELRFEPQPDGSVHIAPRHNDTVIRMKPIWRDNILPSPHDCAARWSRVDDELHLEIAIPQTKDAGLDLTRFEQLGVMFEFWSPAWKQRLRLFEPQSHFDVTLR